MKEKNLKNKKTKEIKIVEKAIENFLKKALDYASEKDFLIINI